uniref:Uncharacterized protein n=1 Tax=Paramormyrops kingsleyae TaxID=1676925 RepID=A0A3B3QYE8_9TELE
MISLTDASSVLLCRCFTAVSVAVPGDLRCSMINFSFVCLQPCIYCAVQMIIMFIVND